MHIRPLLHSDYEQWKTLWKSYLAFYEATLREEITESTWQKLLANHAMQGLGVIIDNKLVAFAHLVFHSGTWAINEHCYLEDLFVAPEFRHQGIAKKLIEFIYRFAEQRHCERVYWITSIHNQTAQSLYDKLANRTDFIQYRYNL